MSVAEWPEGTALLHIVAQAHYHEPAFIAGNRDGLLALKKAIDKALMGQARTACAEVCPNDGEGFRVYVRWLGTGEIDAVPYGYTDTEACPKSGAPWPNWMRFAE